MFGRFTRRPAHQHGTIHLPVKGLIQAFLLARRAGGCTTATITWYEPRLERFAAFVQGATVKDITADQVRHFLIAVKTGVDGETRDTYVESYRRALAALFTWAVNEGILTSSPLKNVAHVRTDERAIVPLTTEEVRRLIAAQPTRTRAGMRNAAIVAFLYDTGVRVGELVQIRIADVDLEQGRAVVRGKSRREDVVPLSLSLRRVLLAYIHRARSDRLFDESDGRLFLNTDDKPLTTTAVNQMLNRAARRAGITRAIYPHLFRHSMATAYLRNGGDEFTLQRILRHRTSTMTRRYVHVAAGDVLARHAAASPLERLGL